MRRAMIWAGAAFLLLFALAAGGWLYVMGNVEQPSYALVEAEGAVEIRDYPALVVAEVERAGSRGEAVRAGFGPLAGYIFAREREGEKIAMTAPVTQRQAGEAWAVRFIMPSEYRLEDLPLPAGAEVSLKPLPPMRRAAIRFSGRADDALIAAEEAKLRAFLAARGLEPAGPPEYAYYNDPWTPGFLRRNEVLFDLAPAG
ncbi:MAG: SOUL family heme-binding protein [Pikeienuella sp.]|uniref:SOUL family heme-binding protein n=1 Tax=Pikeienuella sp. TaxID=2831957 RepID=UPI003919065B